MATKKVTTVTESIKICLDTKKTLESKKMHRRQSYDEVIRDLLALPQRT